MLVRHGATALLTVSIGLAAIGLGAPATASTRGPVPVAAAANHPGAADGHDPTIRLDEDGRRYVVDPAPEPPAGYRPDPSLPPRAQAGTAQAGVAIPALSSRTGAARTIYLDFDGVNLPSSSAWLPDIPAGSYGGFSRDASADFNAAEAAFIEKTWRITAEKFAPFDINVTTVDPGQAALVRTNAADTTYGIQVVVTDDPRPKNLICDGLCAGIAYVDTFDGRDLSNPSFVFDTTPYLVAWVFSSETYGSAQVTAADIAHEAGHTLGLSHDGSDLEPEYYEGHGNWGPIMGLLTTNAVYQFSKGEYAGANNHEDDIVLIGRNGTSGAAGSLLIADDFTTTSGAPTGPANLGAAPSYLVSGVISSAADDDLFTISRTCTSPLTAAATGIGSGQSVDLRVEILSSTGTVLASDSPDSGPNRSQPEDPGFIADGLDATATVASTTSGTSYQIRVDGDGSGNPLTTGYSDYGSVGRYQLSVSGCSGGAATTPGPPASANATPNPRTRTGTVRWTPPVSDGGSPITGYRILGLPEGEVSLDNGSVTSYLASGLDPGTTYNLTVLARNALGASSTGAATTLRVETWAPTTKPVLTVTRSGSTATLSWTAPAITGDAVLTGWRIDRTGPGVNPADKTTGTATSTTMAGLAAGAHSFTVRGIYAATDTTGVQTSDPRTLVVTTAPGAPRIGAATSGTRGGPSNAVVRWAAPASTGGTTITRYTVIASRVVGGKVTRTVTSGRLSGSARALVFALRPGRYKFRVVAYNSVGASPSSTFSRVVIAR